MKSQLKVGDKVRISEAGWQGLRDTGCSIDGNPRNPRHSGEVVSNTHSIILPYRVKWAEGMRNSYEEGWLELADVTPDDMDASLISSAPVSAPPPGTAECKCPAPWNHGHSHYCGHWKPAGEREVERYKLENTWGVKRQAEPKTRDELNAAYKGRGDK